MSFGGGKKGVRADINITPLVDVVLVLLIIFMVASPTLLRETPVAVPDTAQVEMAVPSTESQVVVSMDAKNQLALAFGGGREPIAIDALGARISALMTSRTDKVVFFDVDDDASYGVAVRAMDACRGAGAKTLGIMTK